MNFKLYSEDEINELAYNEFVEEVHSSVIHFEHIVDAKTGMMAFNETNVDMIINAFSELKEQAKSFTPYFGGNDLGYTYDYSDKLWEEIWNCWGK